ncbi:MAG: acetyl-CoA carboxylase biotin carboxyl carrier protein subunit [Bacteroidales bacterium]|nr:acetyl-CoA carboxylase biotin carboxyl carrier protein subunit [Bacteroidales bacterium]
MQLEIKANKRMAEVEILEQSGSHYKIKVDDLVYDIDLERVGNGIYSLLMNGKSYDVESFAGENPKKLTVNTFYQTVEVEVVDAMTRYLRARQSGNHAAEANQIRVPMPGKVIDVLVAKGDTVTEGQTLVIVSAMKMESEYKAGKEATVKSVKVKPGDTVDSNQLLIELD